MSPCARPRFSSSLAKFAPLDESSRPRRSGLGTGLHSRFRRGPRLEANAPRRLGRKRTRCGIRLMQKPEQYLADNQNNVLYPLARRIEPAPCELLQGEKSERIFLPFPPQ